MSAETTPEQSRGRLIISRRTDESVLIGDDVEIVVLKVSRDKVKLSIQAPLTVSIKRKELVQSLEPQNTP